MAKLIGIARRKAKRAPMEELNEVSIGLEYGIEDDFRGKAGKRQITVLSKTGWEQACTELGVSLEWTKRRANLLLDELDLQHSCGKVLEIGEVELLITQETDPCKRMKEVHEGLLNALAKNWRGGVCCRVIKPGTVKQGDEVLLKDLHG